MGAIAWLVCVAWLYCFRGRSIGMSVRLAHDRLVLSRLVPLWSCKYPLLPFLFLALHKLILFGWVSSPYVVL